MRQKIRSEGGRFFVSKPAGHGLSVERIVQKFANQKARGELTEGLGGIQKVFVKSRATGERRHGANRLQNTGKRLNEERMKRLNLLRFKRFYLGRPTYKNLPLLFFFFR